MGCSSSSPAQAGPQPAPQPFVPPPPQDVPKVVVSTAAQALSQGGLVSQESSEVPELEPIDASNVALEVVPDPQPPAPAPEPEPEPEPEPAVESEATPEPEPAPEPEAEPEAEAEAAEGATGDGEEVGAPAEDAAPEGDGAAEGEAAAEADGAEGSDDGMATQEEAIRGLHEDVAKELLVHAGEDADALRADGIEEDVVKEVLSAAEAEAALIRQDGEAEIERLRARSTPTPAESETARRRSSIMPDGVLPEDAKSRATKRWNLIKETVVISNPRIRGIVDNYRKLMSHSAFKKGQTGMSAEELEKLRGGIFSPTYKAPKVTPRGTGREAFFTNSPRK